MSWLRELFGEWSSYKARFEQSQIDNDRLLTALENCRDKLDVYENQWQPETEQRSSEWLHGIISEKFPKVVPILLDGNYWFCSKEDMRKIIETDWTENRDYIKERFDCDDFARQFVAHTREYWNVNQVGLLIDWGSLHAYNIIFFADGDAWIFEPQNDRVYPFDYRDEMYQLTNSWLEI